MSAIIEISYLAHNDIHKDTHSNHHQSYKKDGYRQLNVRQLGSLCPWDNSGKCYMDRKRIQCLLNASQHAPIYLQPVIQAVKSKGRHFSTFFAYFGLPWVRPWNNRGKCYMDRKRIQCLSNASQHVPIYLQPFMRYSKILVENYDIFTPHLCLAAPQGLTPLKFREDLDIHKTRMNGLSCGEESMTIYSAVLIQCQRVTDGQTDGRRQAYSYYVLQHS